MSTLTEFMQAVAVIRPYYTNPDGYHLGADHDVIYLYPTDISMSEEDIQKLLDLGLFQPDEGISKSGGSYDPEVSWCCYV